MNRADVEKIIREALSAHAVLEKLDGPSYACVRTRQTELIARVAALEKQYRRIPQIYPNF
jgi:BMFP domain-containing protein YqiC